MVQRNRAYGSYDGLLMGIIRHTKAYSYHLFPVDELNLGKDVLNAVEVRWIRGIVKNIPASSCYLVPDWMCIVGPKIIHEYGALDLRMLVLEAGNKEY